MITKVLSRAILLATALVAVAVAQLPEPPKNSEVAFRLLPMPTVSAAERDALRSHPLFKMVGRVGAQTFGFEPLKFLDETFEGTLVAAIVTPEGGSGSSILAFLDYQEQRDSWSSMISELEELRRDLKEYFEGADQDYPESIATYLEETRYYDAYLPSGVTYSYRRLDQGKGFELTTTFEDGAPLAGFGRPPLLRSDGRDENLKPTRKPVPLNYVAAARIKDRSKLSELLTKGFGAPRDGFWRTDIDNRVDLIVTIRGDWVVAADRLGNMGPFLDALGGQAPGWSQNPSFKTVARNLDSDASLLFFVDAPRMLWEVNPQTKSPESRLMSLVGPVGYAVVPKQDSQARVEVFLGVKAPPGSRLDTFMRGDGDTASTLSLSNIPWDVSNMFALEYANSKELLDALVALFPEAQEQYGMGQDVFAGMLGLDAEAGFDKLFDGPAVVSFERIDIFLNAMEEWARKAQTVKEVASKTGGPVDKGDGDEAVEVGEVREDPENPVGYFPATIACKVPIASNREALLNLLSPYMGDTTTETMYGVELVTSQDGKVCYAVDGDWVYLSGGRTERLLKHMLEAAHGRKETLASLDSWSRFTLSAEGRVLAFGHQKLDAIYSLAKGFLLLLGSDFRPVAVEIGKLRDYHSVATVVPEGIMLVGEVFKGDGR